MLKKYAAAILCGGQSRRMGFDKATGLKKADGRPLLSALAEELAARFGETILVTNDPKKFNFALPFPTLMDLHPGAGPAGAVHTALTGLPGRAVFIMACDMPVVHWPLIQQLAEELDNKGAEAAIPRHRGKIEPLYAFYGPAAEPVFKAALAEGQRKMAHLAARLKTAWLDLATGGTWPEVFKNLNTPEEARHSGLRPEPD